MSEVVGPLRDYDGSEIAVVGMAGRFPGAADVDRFWENLTSGVESIRFFTDQELVQSGVPESLLANPDYVKARPTLSDVDRFDAPFFGLAPKEAEVLDPQHRVFMEVAWEALESAGYDPERYRGVASVYAGASFSNYLVHNLYKNRPVMESFGDLETTIANVQDSLATMLGYKLNFRGACCAVQTFCSTSLVSVHLACQNLLNFESDMALAGGVSIYVPQESGYLYSEGSIVSPDGRCRPFDEKARGTIFGNGAGAVVLRRLEDALRDGDVVHAVIRGSAVNNDGSMKVSYAAPGMRGQTEVIVEALSASGVDPETIGLVEAHGTGTTLGDPVEVSALSKAFRTRTEKRQFCALGSVKSNVGHLDAAAGAAGLIKAILALKHKKIPPSLHFERPNPEIDFEASPFYVPTELRDWEPPSGGLPRRAAVSAFGIGGTNAHVILEEAPEPLSEASPRPQLLVLSAKTAVALESAAGNLASHLRRHPESELADVAFTLQIGRGVFAHRLSLPASSASDAAKALEARAGAEGSSGPTVRENPPVTFVLRGEGMGEAAARDLYRCAQRFREEIDRENEALRTRGEEEIFSSLASETLPAAAVRAVENALAEQYKAWGVLPAPDSGADPIRLEIGGEASMETVLETLGRLWRSGVEIDWARLHEGERRRRVVLPTYPFERQRYWVEPEVDPNTIVAKREEPATWFYHPEWKSSFVASSEKTLSRYLVVVDSSGVGEAVARSLASRGRQVQTIGVGEDYGDLHTGGLDAVLHLGSLAEGESFEESSERGFYSLLRLLRALRGGDGRRPVRIKVVTAGAHDVTGQETLRPEAAMIPALLKVVAQENEGIVCENVDLDPMVLLRGAQGARGTCRSLVERLTRELERPEGEPIVALRGERRWTPSYETIPVGSSSGTPPLLRPSGVYWITGGLGEVGYTIAAYLATKVKARLILTGRTAVPPREEWQRHLADEGGVGPISIRIRKVRSLEVMGAEVLAIGADVSDEGQMRAALSTALERFGEVHGVIHAAGVVAKDSFSLIEQLSRDACERQFDPKIRGIRVLDRLLRERRPDFWFLTSSLSVVLGGLGYAAYAAANAFLDAYAAQRNREDGEEAGPWKVIDWDQWSFSREEPKGGVKGSSLEELAMTPLEGLRTFERALHLDPPHRTVISTAPLGARLERWVTGVSRSNPPQQVSKAPSHARPTIATEYVAPRNEIEETTAGIWQDLLGIDRVGIHDDFFALGGHSLFAARVLSRLKDAFSVSLPLPSIFDRPTVAGLAERIQAVLWLAKGGEPGSGAERAEGTVGERVEVEL